MTATCAYSTPLISVVMPCFNASAFLGEAVASVFGQSYGHVELVVVDDGSDDGSVGLLAQLQRQHGDRMQVLHQSHKGPYPARNLGLRHVRGELVCFLDADDYWRDDFLSRCHDALASSGADVAYCGWQNFGEGAPGLAPYVPPAYEASDPVAHFLRSCPWPIHAALVRRPIIDAVKGFSERCFSSMDYDLWLRILGQTRRIVRVPEVMAFYRWHTRGQVSSVKWRQVLDALAAQQSFIREHPQLIGHLEATQLAEWTEGRVLGQAYRAIWHRDLDSAHRLFRHAARARSFGTRNLPHVAAALLPMPLYKRLVGLMDRKQT